MEVLSELEVLGRILRLFFAVEDDDRDADDDEEGTRDDHDQGEFLHGVDEHLQVPFVEFGRLAENDQLGVRNDRGPHP